MLHRRAERYNAAVASGTDPLGRKHLPLPIERVLLGRRIAALRGRDT